MKHCGGFEGTEQKHTAVVAGNRRWTSIVQHAAQTFKEIVASLLEKVLLLLFLKLLLQAAE